MSVKDSFRNSSKRQQLINEQRKKLEELRLQTQSQNTKLLKIQQKQRQVETQYQNQKRNMEQTLAKLALEAQNFMNKQASTTQQFEAQKEQIFANDRKKQQYLKQKLELQAKNSAKRNDIEKYEEILSKKRVKLAEIRQQIKKHQIYEQFLKEVKSLSEDFNTGEFDQFSVMTILDRYFTMKKKKEELSEVSKKLEMEKEKKVKRIVALRKEKEQAKMQYNSQVKDLKGNIDRFTEENTQLSSELEGKLSQNGQKQREIGQIIFSIRGLYLSIVGQEKHPKTTLQMLQIIREQRKKLKQYLQLFQKKSEQKSKS